MTSMTIGKVAKRADVGVETIRFYEREGLIEEPPRRASGYRQYPTDTVGRVRFIRRAKELGFTLKEIKALLALRLDGSATRSDVRTQAAAKVIGIEARIRDLQQMRDALSGLIDACHGDGAMAGCPILEAMNGENPVGTQTGRP